MQVPVGLRYEASAVDLCEVGGDCGACRAERRGSVITLAHGEGTAPMFMFRRQAQEEAAEAAHDALPEVARLLLRLARCPGCGARDEETVRARRNGHAWRWAWRGIPLALLALVAEVALMSLVLDVDASTVRLLGMAAVNLALVVAIATRVALKRDLALADMRVEWTRMRANGEKKWKKLGGWGARSPSFRSASNERLTPWEARDRGRSRGREARANASR